MDTMTSAEDPTAIPEDLKQSILPGLLDALSFRIPKSDISQMWEYVAHRRSALANPKEFNVNIAVEEFLDNLLCAKQRIKGHDNAEVFGIMHSLGSVQTQLGRYERALQIYHELLNLHEAAYGQGSSYAVMSTVAFLLNKQGKFAEAEHFCRRLLPILQGMMGLYSPKTLGTMRQLIGALAKQGKWDEAEDLLNEGSQAVEQMANEYQEAEIKAMKRLEEELRKKS